MHVGIFGDSWGCGEWGGRHTSNYGIRHRGLAQYLIESRIKCRQFSVPNGSNYLAIERYEENYKTLDYAIFILTEPFRDFLHGRKYNPKKGFPHTVEFHIKSELNKSKVTYTVSGTYGGRVQNISFKPILKGVMKEELIKIKNAIESSDSIHKTAISKTIKPI